MQEHVGDQRPRMYKYMPPVGGHREKMDDLSIYRRRLITIGNLQDHPHQINGNEYHYIDDDQTAYHIAVAELAFDIFPNGPKHGTLWLAHLYFLLKRYCDL